MNHRHLKLGPFTWNIAIHHILVSSTPKPLQSNLVSEMLTPYPCIIPAFWTIPTPREPNEEDDVPPRTTTTTRTISILSLYHPQKLFPLILVSFTWTISIWSLYNVFHVHESISSCPFINYMNQVILVLYHPNAPLPICHVLALNDSPEPFPSDPCFVFVNLQ